MKQVIRRRSACQTVSLRYDEPGNAYQYQDGREDRQCLLIECLSFSHQSWKEQVRKRGLPPQLGLESGGKPLFLTCSFLRFTIKTSLLVSLVDDLNWMADAQRHSR